LAANGKSGRWMKTVRLAPWLKRGTLKLCLRPFGMNTKVDSEQFNFEHFGANQWFNQFDNV
jgi:hypothetical protein